MNDSLLSLLGLCNRARLLGWGHDACMLSLKNGSAQLCLLASDASDRLKREFLRASQFVHSPDIIIETQYTIEQFRQSTGRRAAVLTINDEGFAKKAAELHQSLFGGMANDK